MGTVGLPIDNTVVDFELPKEHLSLMARYLTLSNGKDRRVSTPIRDPLKYGPGIVNRRLRGLREHPQATALEMARQMAVWLRCARLAAMQHEPSPADVVEWYLSGTIRGFGGTLPTLTEEQARNLRIAAIALLGHACGKAPDCAVCDASARGWWDDVLKLTDTDPQLVLELYRGFRGAGYPAIPARANPADPYDVDF